VGFGLLDRTEALLDALLPVQAIAEGSDGKGQQDDEDELEDEAKEGSKRMLSLRWAVPIRRTMVRAFSLQLSKSTLLGVTVFCVQDRCMAILQRLRVRGCEQWGTTLQGSTGETGSTGTGVGQSLRPPAVAVRVAQQAYLTCDRLLSGRLGRLVEGVVGTLVGEQGAALAGLVGSAKAAGGRAASKEFASLEEGGPATKELAIEAVEATDKEWETRCFRLVVKNSFIEFAEDGPARPLGHQRKARSCDDLQSFFGRYSEESMIVDVGICRRDAVPTTPTMSDDAPRQDPAQMAGESVVAAAYRPSVLRPPPLTNFGAPETRAGAGASLRIRCREATRKRRATSPQ
jgi:hypothetical protein